MTMGLACDRDGYDLRIPPCKRCGSRGCQNEKCASQATPEPVVEAGGVSSKRPVAWRVKDYADGWIIFQDEAPAYALHEQTGALMQGLYVRDGAAPATSAPATRKENTTMAETEIQRLQREITERQSRLAQLVLGDQTKSVGWPPDDVNPQASGLENCCEQEEGA